MEDIEQLTHQTIDQLAIRRDAAEQYIESARQLSEQANDLLNFAKLLESKIQDSKLYAASRARNARAIKIDEETDLELAGLVHQANEQAIALERTLTPMIEEARQRAAKLKQSHDSFMDVAAQMLLRRTTSRKCTALPLHRIVAALER